MDKITTTITESIVGLSCKAYRLLLISCFDRRCIKKIDPLYAFDDFVKHVNDHSRSILFGAQVLKKVLIKLHHSG